MKIAQTFAATTGAGYMACDVFSSEQFQMRYRLLSIQSNSTLKVGLLKLSSPSIFKNLTKGRGTTLGSGYRWIYN
jgi:hypothetical protein